MYCYKCGATHPADAEFCMKCGAHLVDGRVDESLPSSTYEVFRLPDEPSPFLSPDRKQLLKIGLGLLVGIIVVVVIATKSGEYENAAAARLRAQERELHLQEIAKEPLENHIEIMESAVLFGLDTTLESLSEAALHAGIAMSKAPENTRVQELHGNVIALLAKYREWTTFFRRNEIEAIAACQVRVKSRLRAPSTASLIEYEASFLEDRDRIFLVNVVYDAENAFGARIRNKFHCVVDCTEGDRCLVERLR